MLSAVLAVVLGLTLVWLARLLIRDRSNRLLRAVFLCIGCAALSYPFGTPGGVRFADGAVGDGTAKFTQNAFLLCAVYFLMCFFVHAASDRETAVPHTRRALVPLGATLLVIALATWATPAAERGHTYATADMRTVPVACFYLVAGLYLAYALAVALVWSVRYARGADRPLATGLWLVAGALVTIVSASAVREVLTLMRMFGWVAPGPLITGVRLLLDLAIPLFVVGVVYPGVATRWASMRLWWHHLRMYRRLAPLWAALNEAFPEDALPGTRPHAWHDGLNPTTVHRRYYRRVIECRDGLVRVSPHLAVLARDTHPEQQTLAPEAVARHLRTALRSHAEGRSVSSQPVPIALPRGEELEDDVAQLALISEALGPSVSR